MEAPIYEPKKQKPDIDDLYDVEKYNNLIMDINKADISDDDKEMLRLAASRHIVFNYQEIADYYANSDEDVQILMEKSALVIIDFDKAIENGFVNLSKEIADIFLDDYEGE